MFNMCQIFWKIFMLTGNVDAYLLYKELMSY
ncbi:YqzL family protein [Caminicella sporogenes]